ncbi:hypothetical protein Taro_009764 [Colocasia esculenta]|uniref:Glucan endo-1,3-beta-D-glucosidase n=1 Tax=Colocasia esculenta TaxID=4460 RepID=A0A843U149_COLES|nr:hypothetical protein [Colocasia esculenta]
MKQLGFGDVEIVVSEMGWPSRGEAWEMRVDAEKAREYNANVVGRTSERNFGLFMAGMTPVYDIGILRTGHVGGGSTELQLPPPAAQVQSGVRVMSWCLPKPNTDERSLQVNIDFTCGQGLDCRPTTCRPPLHQPSSPLLPARVPLLTPCRCLSSSHSMPIYCNYRVHAKATPMQGLSSCGWETSRCSRLCLFTVRSRHRHQKGTIVPFARNTIDFYPVHLLRDNVLAYWPDVRFRYVAVGNEVIFDKGWPSTSSRPCTTSTSPSPSPAYETRSSLGAPLLVNLYPYFSNVGDPQNVDLDYAQFTMPDIVVVDGYNDFEYQNLFDAMVDVVYAALDRVGAGNVDVVVSETSCPSARGFTATVENARIYNTCRHRHRCNPDTARRANVWWRMMLQWHQQSLDILDWTASVFPPRLLSPLPAFVDAHRSSSPRCPSVRRPSRQRTGPVVVSPDVSSSALHRHVHCPCSPSPPPFSAAVAAHTSAAVLAAPATFAFTVAQARPHPATHHDPPCAAVAFFWARLSSSIHPI